TDRGGLTLVARHLPARMDAAVGPAGDRERHRRARDRPDRLLEGLLNGAQPGLLRPPGELGAVVLEQQPRAYRRTASRACAAASQPRLRATIRAYSFSSSIGRAPPAQRSASSRASVIRDSHRSGGRFCFAATHGGAEVPSAETISSGESKRHGSVRISISKRAASPSKRSRTLSSSDHSSESGWSPDGGA